MKKFSNYKAGLLILLIIFFLISCTSDEKNSLEAIIEEPNAAPEITSSPLTQTDHNREYKYVISVTDKNNDEISIKITYPSWLTYNEETKTLLGTASWNNIGNYDVLIIVSDNKSIVEQKFTIKVNVGEIICNSDFGDPAKSIYILPFKVGKTYKNIQGYCPPNPAWGHHNWFAYDFDMNIGDTIIAMRSGKVIAIQGQYTDGNRQPGKENYIFVLHKDGTVASYYHLTKNGPLVRVGQTVTQGEIIGLSGDTGASIGSHLHIAVFRGRTSYSRQYSIPINFRNANGSLNSNNGLVYLSNYEALNFTPNTN